MTRSFHVFERFGVELEYMIVDRDSLDILPISDRILHAVAGAYESEVEIGPLHWSNELVLHVIELKTGEPAAALAPLAGDFQRDLRRINELLEPSHAMLMPTAMHPWMDPFRETRLWPHEYNPVYEAFDRIFDCRGHGWSNLQATHINLPFADDEEFGRLHAAIRLMLPILPALAASSPLVDGKISGLADARLEAYRNNAIRIPSISGNVIPEPVFTTRDYQAQILRKIYDEIAPFDPDEILREEWVNARGAIARFDRNTIEIRLLDVQECVRADLAILGLIVAALRACAGQRWSPFERQCQWPAEPLASILLACIARGEEAVIENRAFLEAWGLASQPRLRAGELWRHLLESTRGDGALGADACECLRTIFSEGTLSRRILRALNGNVSHANMQAVYRKLCDCLADGVMFHA